MPLNSMKNKTSSAATTAMPEQIVLETRNLTMRFGGFLALNRINFTLRERELRCLIGPNGAGKSTFFGCVTGLLKPTEGDVFILRHRTTGWNMHGVSQLGIGTKTQIPNVMNGLSVYENIWLSANRKQQGISLQHKVEHTLERLNIAHLSKKAVANLSHGHRQLVELGTVLAADPWLVFLDEPAAGITHEEAYKLAELLREINQQVTLLVVEHDMKFVKSIAQRVTVFHQGEIFLEESVDEALQDERVKKIYLGKQTP